MKKVLLGAAVGAALLRPLRAAAQAADPPGYAGATPAATPLSTAPFWHRFIFTGGTSVVFPLEGFKRNLSPAFSAATGADFAVTERLFLGGSFSYNRHRYHSNTLYPGIQLKSNTELLSLFFNARVVLGSARHRVRPYVFAGPGVSVVSRPSIGRSGGPDAELLVGDSRTAQFMGNVGAGLDVHLNPMILLYVESTYNTSFAGSRVAFAPVLVGLRTYPPDLFKKN